MPVTITIRDESTLSIDSAGKLLHLELPTESITVRELIRTRVYCEVEAFNASHDEVFRGLVQPNDTEQTLNGFRMKQRRQIDPEEQYQQALRAFERNGFILLIDDHQVDDLDACIELSPDTSISFLKLVPLAGG